MGTSFATPETPFFGKVALVTGAASGIGRASALHFAKLGAAVAVVDWAVDQGERTVGLIRESGGEARFIGADVSSGASVRACLEQVVGLFGRLDFAHNNAGVEGEVATVVDGSEEVWDRTLAINLKGIWLCMRSEIPLMLKNGGGAIVNTSSVAGLVGQQGAAAYCASKHGVIGLTKVAALENIKLGVRINAICPGLVSTAMVQRLSNGRPGLVESLTSMSPIGRAARPEEIAAAVVWLCSDAASYVVGQAMPIDGAVIAQ